jgi:hypothetical protein
MIIILILIIIIIIIIIIRKPTQLAADFFLDLLFGPEDKGDIILRNVGLCQNYKALQLSGL